ncbi:Non-specific serine/threonine protein kinase protein [Dioscorea alata]|uniref:Non-specific serine/threonine protein kinase protein n=1 Tax=Dioscorea alata TaxID=55571 RepID=A0ACB7V3C9_DIOAL|nr:Non-specific serine/threonine protein kinase protein [Dioscorea alata]
MPFITGTSTSTTTASDSTTKGCIKAERDALLAFKAQIIHHKAHPISSWGDQNDDDCCHWVGVRCSNNTGHVFRLELQRKRPRQYYYDDFDYYYYYYIWDLPKCDELDLSGNISESLIGLQHLTYLDLSNNCFLNISIPKFLGSLEHLVHLDLSYSSFTGVIPHELGNLTRLRYLNLATYYYYEHGYKVDDAEWLSGLSSLRYLSMDGADFYGVNNVMQSLNKLRHLKSVSLNQCSMNSIPESLPHLNFTSLTFMDIGWNMFDNTSIPEWLFRIPNLRELHMSINGFTGAIPSSVGNATSLQFLDLSYNEGISGDMPREFGDLCNLQSLNLDGTFIGKSLEEDFRGAFSGCIRRNLNELSFHDSSLRGPLPDWLGEFQNLTFLYLSRNSFNSSIPASIGKLSKLQKLRLYDSALIGSIPSSIGNATSLQFLSLSDNSGISGDMPSGFGDLCNLQSLNMDGTFGGKSLEDFKDAFSGCIRRNLNVFSFRDSSLQGPLPDWLGEFQNLTFLDLSYNSFHSSIPASIGKLSQLHELYLYSSALNGFIPESLGTLSTLQILSLSGNALNGSIPQSLGRLSIFALDLSNNLISGNIPCDLGIFDGRTPQLNSLSLSTNYLTGSIPNSLCNLVGLALLDLSNNHLEGAIPNCWNNLTSLEYLILANNSLAGEIPNSLVSSSQYLEVLHLSNNQLHGEFPSFLKKCTFMTTLALDHNNLSGGIPSWVGKTMTSLMILTLKENNFTGNLPLLSNLTSLHFLDLSHNLFVGGIPQSYGSLMGMINVNTNGGARFSSNTREELIIKIFVYTKGIELQFGVTLSSFKFIDLSANNLSGQIPKKIVNLVGLQNLDLSCNNLSGEIPKDIGRMQSLESLNLSRNELIGSIPPGLSTLHFLESLNLSYNNLSGKIPYASQLTTFNDPSIYANNFNLCGAPLDKNCASDEPPSASHDQENDDDDEDGPAIWFYIGLMLGFVFGFWIVWGILLFKNKWRHIYFMFLDHTFDMMHVKIVVTIHRIKKALVVMKSK